MIDKQGLPAFCQHLGIIMVELLTRSKSEIWIQWQLNGHLVGLENVKPYLSGGMAVQTYWDYDTVIRPNKTIKFGITIKQLWKCFD